MNITVIRNAAKTDFDRVVELNAAVVRETSAMDTARLQELHALALHQRSAVLNGGVADFLLAMRDGPLDLVASGERAGKSVKRTLAMPYRDGAYRSLSTLLQKEDCNEGVLKALPSPP